MYVKLPTPKTTTYMQGDNTQVGLIWASKLQLTQEKYFQHRQANGWLDMTNKWTCAMVKEVSNVGEENKQRKKREERMREEENNLKKQPFSQIQEKK